MIRAAMMAAASRRSTAAPSEPDPLFSQVKLLVHADTNFADSSSMARAVTNVGAVGIGGTSRFGAGAASFTTAGQRLDYAATDAAMNLPAGDFTIELWMKPVAFGTKGVRTLVSRNVSENGWNLQVDQAGRVYFTVVWTNGAPIQVGGQSMNSSSSTPFALIDDLRITVGTARYTAAFTPPTAAFPDS